MMKTLSWIQAKIAKRKTQTALPVAQLSRVDVQSTRSSTDDYRIEASFNSEVLDQTDASGARENATTSNASQHAATVPDLQLLESSSPRTLHSENFNPYNSADGRPKSERKNDPD